MSSVATRLSCSIVDGQMRLTCAGSQWLVPKELVERSPILVDTLQSAGTVGCDFLVAPDGYLESYLMHVSVCPEESASAGRRNASNGSLTRYFQVADYFADEAAMQELCHLLGRRLFESHVLDPGASKELREEKRRTDDKILKQLPSHLLEYVIRKYPASLDEKLLALPTSVHHLAILATFPTISTDHSISFDANQYSARSLAVTFRAMASESRLHCLRVSNLHLDGDAAVLESFTAFISCHSSLQELAIIDWTYSPAALEAICTAVSNHTGIHTLELTQCDISEDNARPITRAISRLRDLRHLTVRQKRVTSCWKSTAVFTLLAKLPHLTHLDLGNNPLSSDDTTTLGQSLFHLSELQQLNLCACYIKQGAQALSPALATLTRLTALKCASNMLQCAGVEALVPAFASLVNLQHLDLRQNGICVAGVRALCCVLSGMTSLQHLYLGSNSMGSSGASMLANSLLCLSNLQGLDMSYNRIRSEGMVELMRVAAERTLLSYLNLAGNAMLQHAVTGVVAPAIAQLHRLQDLDLEISSSCPLKECAQALSAALLGTPKLTSLRLAVGPMTNTPSLILAPALRRLNDLESLDITYSTITELGCKELANGIATLSKLTKLALKQPSAYAFGAVDAADRTIALASTIGYLTHLQHLCMAGLNMKADGVQKMSNALFDLGELRVLLLSSNSICDDGMQALAAPISCLLQLERLELTDCKIADRGAICLASSLSACSQVSWVELTNNSIGDRGALALAHALSGRQLIQRLDIRCNEVIGTDASVLQQQWILSDDYHSFEA